MCTNFSTGFIIQPRRPHKPNELVILHVSRIHGNTLSKDTRKTNKIRPVGESVNHMTELLKIAEKIGDLE